MQKKTGQIIVAQKNSNLSGFFEKLVPYSRKNTGSAVRIQGLDSRLFLRNLAGVQPFRAINLLIK